MFNRLLQFAEAKRPDGRFLILRIANRTLNIFNTYFCHCCSFRQLSTAVAAATTTVTSFTTTTTTAAAVTSLARATTTPCSPALTGFLFMSSEIGRASCRERVETAVVRRSSRRRHTRYWRDWSSDVCSSDLI